jgi:AcrR family transcriptional regulator
VTSGPGGPTRPESGVRQRLREVSTRLFAEQGFEGTSVQEIVDAAGVTKGALYHYVDSKDDLLYDIYARLLRMQTERLERIASSDLPVAERLHAAARDVVELSIAHLDDLKIFFRSLHQLSDAKRDEVRKERRAYHERFRGLIEEGRATGVFRRDDVPPDLHVNYFFGAVHHLGMWYREGAPLRGADVARHFADMLLRALRP